MTSRDARTGTPPPRSVEEALDRARRHGLAALAEATDAAHALLDAASIAASGAPVGANAWTSRAAEWLDAIAADAREGAGAPGAPWLDAMSDALDAEIARWEDRSRHDPEARAVLRAFLGVREILWEFGLRARDASARREAEGAATHARSDSDAGQAAPRGRAPRTARRPPARLERVPVEG